MNNQQFVGQDLFGVPSTASATIGGGGYPPQKMLPPPILPQQQQQMTSSQFPTPTTTTSPQIPFQQLPPPLRRQSSEMVTTNMSINNSNSPQCPPPSTVTSPTINGTSLHEKQQPPQQPPALLNHISSPPQLSNVPLPSMNFQRYSEVNSGDQNHHRTASATLTSPQMFDNNPSGGGFLGHQRAASVGFSMPPPPPPPATTTAMITANQGSGSWTPPPGNLQAKGQTLSLPPGSSFQGFTQSQGFAPPPGQPQMFDNSKGLNTPPPPTNVPALPTPQMFDTNKQPPSVANVQNPTIHTGGFQGSMPSQVPPPPLTNAISTSNSFSPVHTPKNQYAPPPPMSQFAPSLPQPPPMSTGGLISKPPTGPPLFSTANTMNGHHHQSAMIPGPAPPSSSFSPQLQGQGPPPMSSFQSPNTPFMASPSLQRPPPPVQPSDVTNKMHGLSLNSSSHRPYPQMTNDFNNVGGPPPLPHMPPPYNGGGTYPASPPLLGQPPQQQQFQQQGPGGYPSPTSPYQNAAQQQQQQQQRKLDPDQMPSPIQVMEDDRRNRSGAFVTNQKGLMPPLITTPFVVQDQGNCSPRYIRSTMYNVPITNDIMKQAAIPFSLVISPMSQTVDGEYPPPCVDFGELGPVRCVRCKAYMCPFMQFIDSGRRFQCLFCKATTDVPAEYFQHLDHTGQRMDRFERPELILGTYEFLATKDYCRGNVLPKAAPAFIFVLDVSYNSVKSGVVHLLCTKMREILRNLPAGGDAMRVGFITYANSVHFYNIKPTLAAPQMLIVGDTADMFMPLLDGFLCRPQEAEQMIDALMKEIPQMFSATKTTETVLLPAIAAGLEALKASETTGKLLVFHTTLPTAEAPGKLKNRDDRKLLGTDKERTVLTPQSPAYTQLGQDCVAVGCAVDLFVLNNAYVDVATIGQVARLTGGELFKYTYFQADIDGERLINDVIMDISRPIAFDAVMRVRTSTGVRPTDFYGHCFMSNTTDIELAAIDCHKAIAVEIKHDDKLSEDESVYIQAALLYTSVEGLRRLRIINLALKTCGQMADLYRACDCDTIVNYLAKQSIHKLLETNPKTVKENLIVRTAQILATYRKNCASPSSAGQLILPECMKLLPLYVNCLLKCDAISGGADLSIDDRSFAMHTVFCMDVATSVGHFYPRLIPIHQLDGGGQDNEQQTTGAVTIPAQMRCSMEKLNEQGVYILENGVHLFVWIGLGAHPEFMQKVLAAPSAIQADLQRAELPTLDNSLSVTVRAVIEQIRREKHRSMRVTLVRPREKLEPIFKHFLVEDRGVDGSASYVDFLIHMHKEIRQLLS